MEIENPSEFEILIKEITKNKGLVVGIYKPTTLMKLTLMLVLKLLKVGYQISLKILF